MDKIVCRRSRKGLRYKTRLGSRRALVGTEQLKGELSGCGIAHAAAYTLPKLLWQLVMCLFAGGNVIWVWCCKTLGNEWICAGQMASTGLSVEFAAFRWFRFRRCGHHGPPAAVFGRGGWAVVQGRRERSVSRSGKLFSWVGR